MHLDQYSSALPTRQTQGGIGETKEGKYEVCGKGEMNERESEMHAHTQAMMIRDLR